MTINDAAASGEWRVACGTYLQLDIAGCVMSCDMMYRSLSTL